MSESLERSGEPEAVEETAAVGEPLKARQHAEARHPGPREYLKIGAILAILTILEVGVYYIESIRDLLVAILVGLMLLKFVLVARWFMHLKFDNPGYGRVFATGIALAIAVYVVVLAMFGVFT